MKIKYIKEVEYKKDKVYDLSVKDNHNYFVSGINVHNSGKSYVVRNTFPNIKVINSDELFEFLLEKEGLDKIIDSNAPDYDKKMKLRSYEKSITKNKEKLLLNGMIPVILDGTGKDYDKVVNQKMALERLGYDVSMVFVNTNLETAKARNLKRERSVPEDVLENAWHAVQNNIGKFQELFPGKIHVVDNSSGSNLDSKRHDNIYRSSIESPLENRIGKQTIAKLGEIGGKYLTDLSIHKAESKVKDDTLSSPDEQS